MKTWTFTSDTTTAAEVVACLQRRGYVLGDRKPVERTVLDTFDGRVKAAGLRVEAHRQSDLVLRVTGAAQDPLEWPVPEIPRFAGELPEGPVRKCLAPVMDVRALLPRVSMTAHRRRIVRRDRLGTVVAEGALYDSITVLPAAKPPPAWVVEVVADPGLAEPAADLRKHLQAAGLQARHGDALEMAYATAGISRTGFDSSPTVALSRHIPALEGFAVVLDHLARAIAANWEGTIADLDPEFLHDLRVAVRRTRSVLSQGKNVVPAEVRDRFRTEFKWLGDITGQARDLDVYVIEWDGYVARLGQDAASLAPVLDEIERQRQKAHAVLAKTLRTRRAKHLLPSWQQWLAHPRTGSPQSQHADRPLGWVVAHRITTVQKQLLLLGRSIEPDSPGELLHELRKDAKKLRYLLECFGGLLPPAPRKAFVKRLKALQDNLGQHQDAEVHVGQLHELARDLRREGAPTDTLLAMGRLVHTLGEQRQASRTEFEERFGAYDSKTTRAALREVLSEIEA